MDEVQLEYQSDTILRVLRSKKIKSMEFINDMVGFGFDISKFLASFHFEGSNALRAFAHSCSEGSLDYLNILGEIKIKLEELENYFPCEKE